MQTGNIVEEVIEGINLKGVSMSFENVTLEKVATISAGQAAPKDSFFSEINGKPFIRAGHLQELIINSDTNSLPKISSENAKLLKLRLLKSGSILFAKSGMSATLNRVYQIEEDSYYVSHLAAITTNETRLNSRFCKYFLQKFKPSQLIKDSAYPSIGLSDIYKIQIPLPTLAIQQHIADVLDKADALRKKDQQLLNHYDTLAQSLFIDMFGDPVKNEKGWVVKKLGDCSANIQIGPFGTQLHAEDYIEGGIPLINPTHIVQGKIVEQSKLTISKEKYSELKNYYLKEGDIIMGRRGEMGRCALIKKRENGWICGTGSLFIRPSMAFNSNFLGFVLSSKSIKGYLERSSQGVTMANLNLKIVSNIPIISPSITIQNQFVVQIHNIEAQKEKLKAQIQASENLFQTLLQQAFNGTLN